MAFLSYQPLTRPSPNSWKRLATMELGQSWVFLDMGTSKYRLYPCCEEISKAWCPGHYLGNIQRAVNVIFKFMMKSQCSGYVYNEFVLNIISWYITSRTWNVHFLKGVELHHVHDRLSKNSGRSWRSFQVWNVFYFPLICTWSMKCSFLKRVVFTKYIIDF